MSDKPAVNIETIVVPPAAPVPIPAPAPAPPPVPTFKVGSDTHEFMEPLFALWDARAWGITGMLLSCVIIYFTLRFIAKPWVEDLHNQIDWLRERISRRRDDD